MSINPGNPFTSTPTYGTVAPTPGFEMSRRRSSKLTQVGGALSLGGVLLLTLGVYFFVATIDLLGAIGGWSRLIPWWTPVLIGAGIITLTVSFVGLIAALFRESTRVWAGVFMLLSFLTPLFTVPVAVSMGAQELFTRTVSASYQFADQMDDKVRSILVEELDLRIVESIFNGLEVLGVSAEDLSVLLDVVMDVVNEPLGSVPAQPEVEGK